MRKAKLQSVLLAAILVTVSAPAWAKESTFVYADAGEPTTLDPAKANINWEFTVTRNVYDRLVDFDLANPQTLLPALATSWQQDGKKWTFKLRPGVKFHDGSAFTADDVKASLDRLMKIGQGQSYLVSEIASVSVVDPMTVTIETSSPTIFLASNLSRIEMMSAHDIAAHDRDADHGDAWFSQNANGTGAYRFVSWTRGSQIELARNTEWWGKFADKPFDRVIDRFITDGANRARGLEGGEFDLANFVPLDDALRIAKTPGFKTVEGNNLWSWPAIYFNTELAPTNSKAFREALIKSFDYNAMKEFFQGKATTPRGPIPAWFPLSPETSEPEIKQDLDEAKKALTASGVTATTMKCSIPAGFPEFRFAATVLQASAAQIGVTVEIEELPFVEAITAVKSDKSNCLAVGNANLSPSDATKFFSAHYLKGGFFNAGKFYDPELESIVAKLPSESDETKRAAMLKKAFEIVVGSYGFIWPGRPLTVVPEPDSVDGYRINPAEYINVQFSDLHQTK